jgi:DNA-binding IclR family transcriptional regulator
MRNDVTPGRSHRKRGWGLLSKHGTVLVYLALHPGSTRAEVADALDLTQRTVWGIMRDLQEAGALRIRREDGRHYFTVNLSAPLWEPVLSGHTVRSMVREFARGGRLAHGRVP